MEEVGGGEGGDSRGRFDEAEDSPGDIDAAGAEEALWTASSW